MVGNGARICFWENLWWGDQLSCSQFTRCSKVATVIYLPISTILGFSFPFFWNQNFYCNLNDLETEDLERLIFSLISVHLPPSIPNTITWLLSFSSLFLVNSFFLSWSNPIDVVPFSIAEFLWKSKVSSKVKTFAWIVIHKKINTKEMLQLRGPYKDLSPE